MNLGLELPAKATLCHTTVRQVWKADLHYSASFEALLGLKIGRNLSTADLNFSQIMSRRKKSSFIRSLLDKILPNRSTPGDDEESVSYNFLVYVKVTDILI